MIIVLFSVSIYTEES